MSRIENRKTHSSAWIIQTWLSFVLSVGGTAAGIVLLPADGWQKGYLAMGLTFSIGSTISLSKTARDVFESEKLVAKVEEAKVEKLLSKHQI